MPLTAEFVLAELEKHADVLRGFGVKKIGLFGSVARGEARDNSDLDFLVDFQEYTSDALFDTAFFLEDLFECKCDVVPMRAIRTELKEYVFAEVRYAEGV